LLTAIREVGEETGAIAAASRRVGRVRYSVDGRSKVVRYWSMRYLGGDFVPNDEVDSMAWLSAEQARDRLSYDTDRSMVDVVADSALPTSLVLLIRHARAGKRAAWKGEDILRPLDSIGRRQAIALAPLVGAFHPQRVVSADPLRCIQTVQPLVEQSGLSIEVDPAFSDEGYRQRSETARDALRTLIEADRVVAVSSQGEAIPGLIDDLRLIRPGGSRTAKAAFWALGCREGKVISADYYRTRTEPR
jgi:hypothetical protein